MRARFLEVLRNSFTQVAADATMWYLLAPRSINVTSKEDPSTDRQGYAGSRSSVVIESHDNMAGMKHRGSILSLTSSFTYGLFQDAFGLNQIDADVMNGASDEVMAEPMFLTMECSLKRSAKSGGQLYASMPINELPLSVWDLVTGEESGAQGLDEALEAGSVSIILHITVHTIQDIVPWVDDDVDATSIVTDATYPATVVSGGADMHDDFGEVSVLYPDEDEIGLSQFQVETFSRLRKEIGWFIQDEIISLTRRDEPAAVGHFISCIDHLKRGRNDSTLATKSVIQRLHLQFVQPAGIEMFKKELSFDQLQHFYVHREQGLIFFEPIPGTDLQSIESVLRPEKPVPEVWVESSLQVENTGSLTRRKTVLPFYLVLLVTDETVDLFFHTRSMDLHFESSVVDAVRMLVSRVKCTFLTRQVCSVFF